MPIPNPSLDDLTFEQLVEEAKKNIPLFTKTWTNYNLSDPGITLLELFAWLTENQIYTLNKLTKRNYLKFLKLLGVIPLEPDPPKIDLTILAERYTRTNNNSTNNDNDHHTGSFILPKRTPLISKQEEIFVETEEESFIIPSLKIDRCIVYARNQYSEIKIPGPDSVDNSSFSSTFHRSSSSSRARSAGVSENNPSPSVNSEPFFFLFGEDPKIEDCFYLKLEFSPQHVKKNYEISLSFYLFEKDLPSVGQHGFERPEDFTDKNSQSELVWEYSTTQDNIIEDESTKRIIVWSQLDVRDTTLSFSKSGKITFQYPTERTKEKFDIFEELNADEEREDRDRNVSNKGELWVRCRILKQNFHLIPPRVEFILPNTVSCSLGYTTKNNLKNKTFLVYKPKTGYDASHSSIEPNRVDYQEMSNGLSNLIFETDTNKFPVLKLNYLEVSEGEWEKKSKKWKWEKWEKWERVDDLISSRPYEKHYVILDNQKGLVRFGDGENGKVPPKGSKIRAEYKFGNAQHWWIERGKQFALDESKLGEILINLNSPFYHKLVAINPLPSSIGRKAETVGEAIIRARQELAVPFKAVSRSDYEYLAKNTPGLRVGKVRAVTSEYPGQENTIVIAAAPFSISSPAKRLEASRDFLDAIRRHLVKHKLITTRILVIGPQYVEISVYTKIKIATKSFEKHNIIKQGVAESLNSYFSPLCRGQPSDDGDCWDFGRNVYRSNVIAVIQSLPEVDTVLELRLQGSGDNSFHTDTNGNIIMDDLNLVYLKDVYISFK